MSTAMCFGTIDCIGLILVIYFTYYSYSWYHVVKESPMANNRMYRMTAFSPMLTAEGSGVDLNSWGMLRHGCKVNSSLWATEGVEKNASWVVDMQEPTKVNGFWLETSNSWEEQDFRFQIEGSDDGAEWEVLSANSDCRFQLSKAVSSMIPHGHEQFRSYDWSGRKCLWPLMLTEVGDSVSSLVGCALGTLAGFFGRGRMATLLIAFGFAIGNVHVAVGSVALGASGEKIKALEAFISILHTSIWPISMIWTESHALELMTTAVSINISWMILRTALGLGEAKDLPYGLLLFVAIPLTLSWLREKTRRRARLLVQEDKARFDEVWDRMVNDQKVLGQLQLLSRLVESIGDPCAQSGYPGTSRQLDRRGSSSDLVTQGYEREYDAVLQLQGSEPPSKYLFYKHKSPKFEKFAAGWRERSRREYVWWGRAGVDSLEQLYMQSILFLPIWRFKTQRWALASGGHFRAKQQVLAEEPESELFVRWETACQDESFRRRVQFTEQKPVARALQKCSHSYGNSVSQLLDVTRECLYFDDIEQLSRCLFAVLEDKDVRILRIRNRLSPEYDSSRSAGWRDVSLVLRVCNTTTRRLGIEGHCAELLLATKSFAALKSEEVHNRYMVWRACRYYSSAPSFRAFLKSLGGFCMLHSTHKGSPSATRPEFSRLSTSSPNHRLPMGRMNVPRGSTLGSSLNLQSPSRLSISSAWDPDGGSQVVREQTISPETHQDVTHLGGIQVSNMSSKQRDSLMSISDVSASERYPFSSYDQCYANLLGDDGEDEVFVAMVQVVVQKCHWPGGIIQTMMLECRHGYTAVLSGGILDSHAPMTLLFSKRWFWVFVICACIATAIGIYPDQKALLFGSLVEAQHFRFFLHDCGLPCCNLSEATSNGSLTVRLHFHGCDVVGRLANSSVDGRMLQWDYSSPVVASGWQLLLSETKGKPDPLHFELQASADSRSWRTVSVNGCSSLYNSTRFAPAACYGRLIDTSSKDGAELSSSFDVKWHVLALRVPSVPIIVIGNVIAVLLAMSGRPSLSKHFCGGSYQLAGLLYCLSAIVESARFTYALDTSMSWMLFGFVNLCLGYSIQAELGFPFLPLFMSLGFSVVDVVHERMVLGHSVIFRNAGDVGWGQVVLLCLIVSLLIARAIVSRRVKNMVAEGKDRYDAKWQNLLEQQPMALSELSETLEVLPLPSGKPLQYASRSTTGLTSFFLRHGRVAELEGFRHQDEIPLLTSLDQLFCRAAVCQWMLHRKALAWAERSRGHFPGQTAEMARWEEAPTQGSNRGVRFTPLKSVDRAVEKVTRCYNKDGSQLLDLSRETIIFRDVEGILSCVEAIRKDSSVEIMRCKNKLRGDYDTWESLGFRCVQLILRIVTEETTRLGLDSFCHELQLTPQSIWECKTEVGHQNYTLWRNSRVK